MRACDVDGKVKAGETSHGSVLRSSTADVFGDVKAATGSSLTEAEPTKTAEGFTSVRLSAVVSCEQGGEIRRRRSTVGAFIDRLAGKEQKHGS